MLTTFKIIPEEASSNYLVFRERQEPAQDHWAADRGTAQFPLLCPPMEHGAAEDGFQWGRLASYSRPAWVISP